MNAKEENRLNIMNAVIERRSGIAEVARLIGVSERHAWRLLISGHIEGRKLGRDWVVSDLSYKRRRKPKRKKGGN